MFVLKNNKAIPLSANKLNSFHINLERKKTNVDVKKQQKIHQLFFIKKSFFNAYHN
jgi:hypothetical protein